MTNRTLNRSPVRRQPGRRGFTLIELLVVMGIIVMLIALALPAFNFLTGSRSVEGANNQLAAALGIARAEAVGVQETRGLAVYHDVESDRDVAALVELRNGPFDAWVAGTSSAPVSYVYGEYRTDAGKTYVCTQAHTAVDGTLKPGATPAIGYWAVLNSCNPNFGSGGDTSPIVEMRPGAEYLTLPKGINVRAATNAYYVKDTATTAGSAGTPYRYATPAVFMFDANGQVKAVNNVRILLEGLLGTRAGLSDSATAVSPKISDKPEVSGSPNPYRANTGIGLVVFGSDEFKNGTATLTTADAVQAWLDQNASPLLINRFNGTLVKGE